MHEQFTIEVTQSDIDKGIPENACRCPIALAIERKMRTEFDWPISEENFSRICVGWTELFSGCEYVTLDGLRYDMPKEAMTFIAKFDGIKTYDFDGVGEVYDIKPEDWDRSCVEPMSFTLTLHHDDEPSEEV